MFSATETSPFFRTSITEKQISRQAINKYYRDALEKVKQEEVSVDDIN